VPRRRSFQGCEQNLTWRLRGGGWFKFKFRVAARDGSLAFQGEELLERRVAFYQHHSERGIEEASGSQNGLMGDRLQDIVGAVRIQGA
jgi:hypothetical protein